MLCANSHPLGSIVVRSSSLLYQLKAIVNNVENATAYHRLGLFGRLLHMGARVGHGVRCRLPYGEALQYETDHGFEVSNDLRWFNPDELGQAGSLVSRWLVRYSNKAAVGRRRREHYLYLLEHLRHVPHACPLFPELPSGVVPYIFPLVIERPERDFLALKVRGVPIWRWEELAESDCQVSQQYRLRLLQLPCHQALRQQELDWMIHHITEVLETKSSVPYNVSYSQERLT
jgi:hypothetical protein